MALGRPIANHHSARAVLALRTEFFPFPAILIGMRRKRRDRKAQRGHKVIWGLHEPPNATGEQGSAGPVATENSAASRSKQNLSHIPHACQVSPHKRGKRNGINVAAGDDINIRVFLIENCWREI